MMLYTNSTLLGTIRHSIVTNAGIVMNQVINSEAEVSVTLLVVREKNPRTISFAFDIKNHL